MKKFLFLLAAASLTLSSCLKEDDTYKNLQDIYPGLNIYTGALGQNNISLIPADEAMRLAMLVAERIKQKPDEPDFDLSKLMYENKINIQIDLFGSKATVEKQGDSYVLTFSPDVQLPSGYYLDGKITVNTNGKESLADTDVHTPWSVDAEALWIELRSQNATQKMQVDGGSTILYAKSDGSYGVGLDNSAVRTQIGTTARVSDWSGDFSIKSDGAGLAYSQNVDRKFTINGEASGMSLYTYNGQGTASSLKYKIENGVYKGNSRIFGGVEKAAILSNYDPTSFPSPEVAIAWSLESGYLTQTVTYNGITVTF